MVMAEGQFVIPEAVRSSAAGQAAMTFATSARAVCSTPSKYYWRVGIYDASGDGEIRVVVAVDVLYRKGEITTVQQQHLDRLATLDPVKPEGYVIYQNDNVGQDAGLEGRLRANPYSYKGKTWTFVQNGASEQRGTL